MSVYDEIKQERTRQDEQWGVAFDDKNTVNDWTAYIISYAGRAAFTVDDASWREQAVKTAALVIAAIETLDRNGKFPPRHYDES